MQKMKNFIYFIVIALAFSSCNEYQKVLNKGKVNDQYKLATKLYNQKKYNKALTLFEKVVPAFANKAQLERVQFMVAKSHFELKDYTLAGYYFNKFVANYPKSSKIEDAMYYAAYGYYLGSPKYSLDQTDTRKALAALQLFIDKFPTSKRIVEVNKLYTVLTQKVEKKHFEIAKQYYTLEEYNACNVAMNNFLEDYPGTIFKEKALYYKFKANFELGMNSIITKKLKRLNNAKLAYIKFKKDYPNSPYLKELNKSEQILDKQLVLTIKKTNKN